ncbi:Hpt domain-containing protein [Synechococcus moorigangaii CMS01]|nr:Hpt domain-containing protein [Synechococcus moorigangaii CMS01]
MVPHSAADEINLDSLTELVSHDQAVLRDLIETFLSDSPLLIAGMQNAQAKRENRELIRNAHTLKSSSRLFQMEQFACQCQALENAATEQNWALVAELLPQLDQDFQAIAISLTEKLTQLQ